MPFSSRILTKHGRRFIQLPQKKENKIVIKLWRRNVHFSRTQKLRDVGALNSKNNDAHAKDDDVVMEAFVIVLNGERHPEIKVFCPRTLHNARSGLAPRPYDLDCSALTDVHCVFQKCHLNSRLVISEPFLTARLLWSLSVVSYCILEL